MQPQTEASIAHVAEKIAVGGGGVAFLGGVSANEIAAYGGLLIGAVGLVVQVYYKAKADARAKRLLAARLARIEDGEEDDG